MTSLLLANCRLAVTMDDAGTELSDASIAIEDGWITSVGAYPEGRTFDQEIDCRRFMALPGLVNTHHHLYQTLTRAFPESQGQPLFPWLEMLYPIWALLDEEMVFTSTRTGLAELALSGCTTCADHLYVFPDGSENFIDAQVQAARSVGLRFHATRGSMDLGRKDGGLPPDTVVQTRDVILKDSERVVNTYHDPKPGSMLQIALAPCSPFSATPELMLESAGLARELGVRLHTHIAETMDEDAYSRREFGVSPVELLDRVSWLHEDVWLAHCVHPAERDIRLMADNRVSVAHCPTSNMLLGSGLAPTARFLREGIRVGLGVDGSSSNDANDLLQEAKQAVLAARVRDGAHAMSVRQAVRIATRGGADCLGRSDIGGLEVGKAGDVVLFDAQSLECAGGQEDLVAAAVLGGARPDSVIVHGEFVVCNGHLTRCDPQEVAAAENASAARLMARWRDSRDRKADQR